MGSCFLSLFTLIILYATGACPTFPFDRWMSAKLISTEQEDVMASLKRTGSAPFSRRQLFIASSAFGLDLAGVALPNLARADEDSLGYHETL